MNQQRTTAIILARVAYGEADRILTLLTPQAGKLSLMAKGVRKVKSKMAGGIELFSVSEITYLPGRGSMGTLISARLVRHYGHIVEDIARTMLGYELIKLLHKVTEDAPEPAYYHLLEQTFSLLDDRTITVEFIQVWFWAQLLVLAGHTPNLQKDVAGAQLSAECQYEFDYDTTAFRAKADGAFGVNEIKFLRLVFSATPPANTASVHGGTQFVSAVAPLIQTLRQLHLRM